MTLAIEQLEARVVLSGQTVAVIDTGIAYDHPALGGGYGVDYRVVGGWDFAENDADPFDDMSGHGTHVAGIIGADAEGVEADGLASDVDFVALRVFDDFGNGYMPWIVGALDWTIEHAQSFEHPITTVNLSLGYDYNLDSAPLWASQIDARLDALDDLGITITAAAGNRYQDYQEPGLTYPAVSSSVIASMSHNDSGQLSHFSQRHPSALAAPGERVLSTLPGGWGELSGTSMASAYMAGAAVLVRDADPNIDVREHLFATAQEFGDYKRLDLDAALEALTPSPGADFDGDGDVDGSDFLYWQANGAQPDSLDAWMSSYGQQGTASMAWLFAEGGVLHEEVA